MHWELPSCLIIDFIKISPKRTFPFDTGAYRKGFIPSYTTIHNIDDFSITYNKNNMESYIGTFFGGTDNYYKGIPIDKGEFLKKHGVMPTETSIHALISLISGQRIAKELDERRSAIECQFDRDIEIESKSILAIIVPEVYLGDKHFVKEMEYASIDIITYPVYPLNHEYYYYAIYDRCYQYYRKMGII